MTDAPPVLPAAAATTNTAAAGVPSQSVSQSAGRPRRAPGASQWGGCPLPQRRSRPPPPPHRDSQCARRRADSLSWAATDPPRAPRGFVPGSPGPRPANPSPASARPPPHLPTRNATRARPPRPGVSPGRRRSHCHWPARRGGIASRRRFPASPRSWEVSELLSAPKEEEPRGGALRFSLLPFYWLLDDFYSLSLIQEETAESLGELHY